MVTPLKWARRVALGLAGLYVAVCVAFVTAALALGVRQYVRERQRPVMPPFPDGPSPRLPAPSLDGFAVEADR